jgi:hypothetical protein
MEVPAATGPGAEAATTEAEGKGTAGPEVHKKRKAGTRTGPKKGRKASGASSSKAPILQEAEQAPSPKSSDPATSFKQPETRGPGKYDKEFNDKEQYQRRSKKRRHSGGSHKRRPRKHRRRSRGTRSRRTRSPSSDYSSSSGSSYYDDE